MLYVTALTITCTMTFNVLSDLDLWGMDRGQGHCTSSQWGQQV